MKTLSGFRDFFPDDAALRYYITQLWRKAARSYGFVEIDGPTLEPLALYQKKNSGGEILSQLYTFTDKGEREVALRPEMTPTVARMIAQRERHFTKPLRWFSLPNCFRYERQQRGRLREFLQFNADLMGAEGALADAEVIALLIDLLRGFGLGSEDFTIRISSRAAWSELLSREDLGAEALGGLLAIVDKIEKMPEEVFAQKFQEWQELYGASKITLPVLRDFLAQKEIPSLAPLLQELQARGLGDFLTPDLSVVRGLAYYTGVVFEAFALRGKLRAIAGGGRYDRLIEELSEGALKMPAIGFGLGDVVLLELLREIPAAAAQMQEALQGDPPSELYLILADGHKQAEAAQLLQACREAGWRITSSLQQERLGKQVGKQFAAAEQQKALYALIVGAEWPQIKLKNLATREEESFSQEKLLIELANKLS